jgi:uncharacterized protein
MGFIAAVDPLHVLAGFTVGLLVGQTGIGGGALMTPILVLLFGVHPAIAVGTDLLFAAATKSVGTLFHGINRTVDWRIAGLLAGGSVPSAALTLLFISRFDLSGRPLANSISFMLAIVLIATAISLLFRKWILALARARAPIPSRRSALLTVATGAILGVLVTISSIGAGAIGIAALVLLYPKLPLARIVGTDIAHAVPLALAAGSGHWFLGSVDWMLLLSLLCGSVPGIVLGSCASALVPDAVLRPILALTLIAAGGRMVF